jgi:glyoxylase-like metal-dependent hydrolase (beta-lactamase superfamily II)
VTAVSGASAADVLDYDVFVSASLELALPDRLPDGGTRTWAPLSTTLVSGARDAVLVDPPLTTVQARAVGDWVDRSGKRLRAIVITHAHGDHWFTAATLSDRFAGAPVLASPGTIEAMHRAVAARTGFWDRVLPGQIPASPVTAVPAPANRLSLEGHDVALVEVGHSDTDDTSVVHVPDLDLVVAGDVVYNGVHQFLVESADGGRDAWRTALDTVAALRPHQVVAGHKDRHRDDDSTRTIDETRRYLDDADQLLAECTDPVGFFTAMRERHPDRLNPSTLWGSAVALYASG